MAEVGLKIDKILYALDRAAGAEVTGVAAAIDSRAKLLAALISLGVMLSVPLLQVGSIVVWFLPLMVMALACGVNYLRMAVASLVVLPFVVFMAVFNIFYEQELVGEVAGVAITRGWVTAISMVLRALISVQIVMLLVRTTGVIAICRAMQRLGVPAIFAVQMMFVYRFLSVMVAELRSMIRAVDARSAGLKRYPLKLWGQIVAEMLMRTICRAKAVGRAMESRLWDGGVVGSDKESEWQVSDTMFLVLFCGVAVALRLIKI